MVGNGTPLIQLQGVRKIFFTDEVETHALADVHLEIREGEYVAINGPSGCGKTTLLSILGLLDTPSDGSYLLEDKPVANLSPAERAHRESRFDQRRSGDGAAAGAAPCWRDGLHGDARSALREARRSVHPSVRWARGR